MIHLAFHTTKLHFEGDLEQEIRTEDFFQFEADAWELPIEDFKRKWRVVTLQTLGKSHCRAGYTDRLHPEKSWYGHNPETMEKLRRYMEELEREENGSKSRKDP